MYYPDGTRYDQVDGTVLFSRTPREMGLARCPIHQNTQGDGQTGQHPGPFLYERTGDGTKYLVPSILTTGQRDQLPGPVLYDILGDGAGYLVPSFLPGTWSRYGPRDKTHSLY